MRVPPFDAAFYTEASYVLLGCISSSAPRLKRKHPFFLLLLLLLFLLSYFTVRNNSYSHCTACVPPSSPMPYSLLCLWTGRTDSTLCGWKHAVCSHYFKSGSTDANDSNSERDRQIMTFARCVLRSSLWRTDGKDRSSVFWERVKHLLIPQRGELVKMWRKLMQHKTMCEKEEMYCNTEAEQDERKSERTVYHGRSLIMNLLFRCGQTEMS